jgi:hypothetical protein
MEFKWRKLRPSVLTICLNSTEIGEVISERQLRRHRKRAGKSISDDGRHVDLLKYSAWLANEYIWKRYKSGYEYKREQGRRYSRKINDMRREICKKPIPAKPPRPTLTEGELNELRNVSIDLPEIFESPEND